MIDIQTLLCFNCYSVRAGEERECDLCEKGNLIEIDENIIEIIIKLNKKGYETWACCSSHIYDSVGFIVFNKLYSFPESDQLEIDIFDRNKSCIRWVTPQTENSFLHSIQKFMSYLDLYVDNLAQGGHKNDSQET